MDIKKSTVTKVFAGILTFALLMTICTVMTLQMKPKAAQTNSDEFDFVVMSKCTTVYFNWAAAHGGVYTGNVNIKPGVAAGFVGFQSKSDEAPNSFILGTTDSQNGVVYNYASLATVEVTSNPSASKEEVNVSVPSGVDIPDDGSTQQTDAYVDYAGYGYFLNNIGFDQIDANQSGGFRMFAGMLMLVVYIASTALHAFFMTVLTILKYANPFTIFDSDALDLIGSDGSVVDDFGDAANAFMEGLTMIKDSISNYYNILRNLSIFTIIPLLLIIALFRWIMSNQNSATAFMHHFKNFLIRFVFVAIGVPMAFAIYDTLIDSVIDSTDDAVGANQKIVMSTFVDFEKWAYEDGLASKNGAEFEIVPAPISASPGSPDRTDSQHYLPADGTIISLRDYCYNINVGSISRSPDDAIGDTASKMAQFEFSTYQKQDEYTNEDDNKTVVDLLQRYARGDRVTSAAYASYVTARMKDELKDDFTPLFAGSNHWNDFDPVQAATTKSMDTGSYREVNKVVDNAIHRYGYRSAGSSTWAKTKSTDTTSGNPWRIGTGRSVLSLSASNKYTGALTEMGMYNYLNTSFERNGVVVYAPDTTSDQNIKPYHYSVNLVGTTYTRPVFFIDALILLGCTTLIGYLYVGSLLLGNLKAMFQVVPAVFTALLGSMRGIATTIVLLFAVIINIVFTFLMYEIVCNIFKIVYNLITKPVAILLDHFVGSALPVVVLYVLVLLLGNFVLCVATQKALLYRKVVVTSATESVTSMINRLLGTNAAAPNLQAKSGALGTAASLAAGLGLAAANGGLDEAAERLGYDSDENGKLSDNISGSIFGKSDEDHNPFGVVSDADKKLEGVSDLDGKNGLGVDKDGNLVDAEGNKFTDSAGNELGVDENGNLVDSDGDVVAGADDFGVDEDGNLVDGNGDPLKDENGQPINSDDTMSVDEDGNVVDSDGNPVTDAEGNPLSVDEDGNLVDSHGNKVRDNNGQPLKKGANGKIVDSAGRAAKSGKDGQFKDGNGKALETADGKINNNPSMKAHANGNVTDSDGKVLTDENGNPLRVETDPESENYGKLVDDNGNLVTDSNGNALTVGEGGDIRDADGNLIKADENGNFVDANGEPLTTADGGAISNTKDYDGPNTQLQMDERGKNAYQTAEEYVDSADVSFDAASSGGGAASGTVPSGKGSTYSDKASGGTGTWTAPKSDAGADVGLMLSDGTQVNDIALPEGTKSGVITDQGIMSSEDAAARGLDGMEGIELPNGQQMYGKVTSDGGFVPGITSNDGTFTPGVVEGDKFIAGAYDTSGQFHAGVYENGGFTECVFDGAGNRIEGRTMPDGTFQEGEWSASGFTPTGGTIDTNAVRPDMGGNIVGGSTISTGGQMSVLDGNGGSASIYSNGNGGYAFGNGNNRIAAKDTGKGMALVTAAGGTLAFGAMNDQLTIGGVTATASNKPGAPFTLSDGKGGQIPVMSTNGYASIASAGGPIALSNTADGGMALMTGDGGSVGITTGADGGMMMQTKDGGVSVVADGHGGMAISDGNGGEIPITTHNGRMCIKSGGDYVPITADADGNAMIGNNGSKSGTSTYIVTTAGGGIGMEAGGNTRINTSSGAYTDGDGVVELSAGTGGTVVMHKDNGETIVMSNSKGGGGVVQVGNTDVSKIDMSSVADGGTKGNPKTWGTSGTYTVANESEVTVRAQASDMSVSYERGGVDTAAMDFSNLSQYGISGNTVDRVVQQSGLKDKAPVGYNNRRPDKAFGNSNLTSSYDAGSYQTYSGSSGSANNIVKYIQDNPMALYTILRGVANKDVGSVAFGAASLKYMDPTNPNGDDRPDTRKNF